MDIGYRSALDHRRLYNLNSTEEKKILYPARNDFVSLVTVQYSSLFCVAFFQLLQQPTANHEKIEMNFVTFVEDSPKRSFEKKIQLQIF